MRRMLPFLQAPQSRTCQINVTTYCFNRNTVFISCPFLGHFCRHFHRHFHRKIYFPVPLKDCISDHSQQNALTKAFSGLASKGSKRIYFLESIVLRNYCKMPSIINYLQNLNFYFLRSWNRLRS